MLLKTSFFEDLGWFFFVCAAHIAITKCTPLKAKHSLGKTPARKNALKIKKNKKQKKVQKTGSESGQKIFF